MEIERKFLIHSLPVDLDKYQSRRIEQAYLCTEPVVRIRRQDDDYILTYKSAGMMAREEYNLALTREAYLHLKEKADGIVVDAWFTGFAETLEGNKYFCVYLGQSDAGNTSSTAAKEIAIQILNFPHLPYRMDRSNSNCLNLLVHLKEMLNNSIQFQS